MGSGSKVQADWLRDAGGRSVDDSESRVVVAGALAKLLERLRTLEQEISREMGDFRLFGVFLREDARDKWDVVVAATWFSRLGTDPIEFLSDRLKSALGLAGLMMISRIVAIKEQDPFLEEVNDAVQVRHSVREIADVDLAGVPVSRGFILTSIPAGIRSRG